MLLIERDLKPDNILIIPATVSHELKIKICDFGLAAICPPDGKLYGYAGSRYYVAPEMVLLRVYLDHYHPSL
jgi:serine/threonine protein kinase